MTPIPASAFESARWQHAVRVLGIGAALVIVLAVVLVFLTDPIAERVQPIALRFDPDHSLDAENRLMIWRMVRGLGEVFLIGGLAMVAWVWAWLSLARRLPAAGERPEKVELVAIGDGAMLVLAGAILTGLSVRALGRGLSSDEIVTVRSVVEAPAWWDVFSRAVVFNNHIPFSALARVSRALFGTAEWAYRLPAFVLGLLAIPAVWLLGRRLSGKASAGVAVLLLATSPLMAEYSASARGYSGLLLFSTVSTWLFLRLLASPSSWTLLWYVVASGVAVWFHLYASLVLGAQALYLCWVAWRAPDHVGRAAFRVLLLGLLASAGLSVLLYAPVLPRLWLEIQRRGQGAFQPGFPWTIALELSGGIVVVVILVGIGLVLQAGNRRIAQALVALTLALGILVPWMARPFDLYPRFFIFLLPFWILAAGHALVVLGKPAHSTHSAAGRLRRGSAAALLVFIVGSWAHRSWTTIPEEGFRAAAAAMMEHGTPPTVVVSVGVGAHLVSYYLRRPVPTVTTVQELNTLATGADEVWVVCRRGVHETGDQPVWAFLEARAQSQACGNLTLFRWHPR